MKSKNVEIGQKGLVGAASSIQLRLERMLTVLSKTQEFLIEESVNSNPQYVRVPDFIGLNQKVQFINEAALCGYGTVGVLRYKFEIPIQGRREPG